MGPRGVQSDMKTNIKETIKELLLGDDDFMGKVFKKFSDNIQHLENKVNKQADLIFDLQNKVDQLQQNQRGNNICIYGLPETKNEPLEEEVLELLNNKVRVSIKSDDIVKCYRVGSENRKNRPVIVKLDSLKKRIYILKNCKNLKGSRMGVTEDLDKTRLLLYKKAQETFDRKSVYIYEGNIFVKIGNSRHRIKNETDINDLNR